MSFLIQTYIHVTCTLNSIGMDNLYNTEVVGVTSVYMATVKRRMRKVVSQIKTKFEDSSRREA